VRLFVAIDVNDAVRSLAQNAAQAIARAGVIGRFELPEKLHVTVAFLGNVADEQLGDIVGTFREHGPRQPFSIDFDRVGAFPSARRPHTIWIGSSRHNQEFSSCALALRAAFEQHGFRFNSEPQPHVTICRPKRARDIALPALQAQAALRVDRLTLYQSLPAGQTTRYEAIDRTTSAAK
jgi:RNA 2',3'-cyclic 3'-phosphodiesterase